MSFSSIRILAIVTLLQYLLINVASAERAPYRFAHNGKIEIQPTKLGQCFGVIAALFDRPDLFNRRELLCKPFTDLDKVPQSQWADVIKANEAKKHPCKNSEYDRILYLNSEPTRPVDYFTGKEDQLRQWMMSQQDNSINPVNLFLQSMMLNQGNAWNAILTIHQLLRNETRWNRGHWYNYTSSTEKETELINKLIDIRGDLQELGNGSLGDHGGTWYRFFASMYDRLDYSTVEYSNGYRNQSDDCRVCQGNDVGPLERSSLSFTNETGSVPNFATSWAAESVKTLVLRIDPKTLDARKTEINLEGGESAGHMINYLINKQNDPNTPSLVECMNPSVYLKE